MKIAYKPDNIMCLEQIEKNICKTLSIGIFQDYTITVKSLPDSNQGTCDLFAFLLFSDRTGSREYSDQPGVRPYVHHSVDKTL